MDPLLREELMDQVDDVWAEVIRILPLSNGQQDPGRDKLEIYAVIRTGEREKVDPKYGRGASSRSSVMADGGYLRIDRTAYPSLVLKQHDKLVALDRKGEPVFEILSVDDRSHLRLICELGDAS